MEFKASLDTLSKCATAGVFILIAGLAVFSFTLPATAQTGIAAGPAMRFVLSFVFVVLMIAMSFRPTGYGIKNGNLIVHQAISDKVYPLKEIVEAHPINLRLLGSTIRTFGSGGFFGYYGKFYNFKLGRLTLYATQRKNMIFLKTNAGQQIVISPDDVEMLEQLRSSGVPVAG